MIDDSADPFPIGGVFQATLRSALQDDGISFKGETPLAVGPRQPGQSSEPQSAKPATNTAIAVSTRMLTAPDGRGSIDLEEEPRLSGAAR